MHYLQSTAVVANVRNDGAIGSFEPRTFDLMLDQRDSQDKQMKEAIRIIRQLGYETRGVKWADNPGN